MIKVEYFNNKKNGKKNYQNLCWKCLLEIEIIKPY